MSGPRQHMGAGATPACRSPPSDSRGEVGMMSDTHYKCLSQGNSLPDVRQFLTHVELAKPLNVGTGFVVMIVKGNGFPQHPTLHEPPLHLNTLKYFTQNIFPSIRLNPLCIIFPFQLVWVGRCKSLCCDWTHYVSQNKPAHFQAYTAKRIICMYYSICCWKESCTNAQTCSIFKELFFLIENNCLLRGKIQRHQGLRIRWWYFGTVLLHCKYLTNVSSKSKIPLLLLFSVDCCSILLG